MRHMPVLAEVMTAFPVHVDEQMPLVKAAEVMREHGCHHLPVMDDANQVVGLLTTEELRLAETPGHSIEDAGELTAGDLCRRQLKQVDLHTRLDVVLMGMADQGINAVLVLKQDKLAGILTSQDACRAFALWLQKEYLPDDDPGVA
ncbi:MAG: CBS domain-containing protein [Oceanospirillaceae bacterium]|uniref:CBS domain-containing protein n=2 Tax=unclassified Thalassolituus TaxID=2624967 RepID=UPI000C095DC4|nr:CBS domain-containing protein [Thalassolituus sp. UBA6592]MAK91832.1 CBS domain-containing protein [Thalassolituus sp.]MBL34398.1 CBS domain-containing protein [Oceanospirillaceae bacterium]MBS54757.1 CBS domain-containing protein [Oceanospirillaceae bacterium]|tara:strand:- start:4743 stop:5180 length:438 start_codon:yes stop_codon:yes gene_type:complete